MPFRDRPGLRQPVRRSQAAPSHTVPRRSGRSCEALVERGHEIALHGIDAWCNTERGGAELATVRDASGTDVCGVRMHWLYFDRSSFGKLDAAGFDYDATWGYNETIGFRAGTSQVFSPLGSDHLLELPLQIQDTSLLFPGRMHCREDEAVTLGKQIIDTVCETGGVATISWHERSLSPERLWDEVYRELLAILRARGASVRPAREVVSWFRLRRGIDLEGVDLTSESVLRLPDRRWRRRAPRANPPPRRRDGKRILPHGSGGGGRRPRCSCPRAIGAELSDGSRLRDRLYRVQRRHSCAACRGGARTARR